MNLFSLVGLLYITAGTYLYRKNKRSFLLISPIAVVIGFIFDVLGHHFNFWRVRPFRNRDLFHSLPIHLGIYPMLAVFFIQSVQRKNRIFIPLLLITIFTTLLETLYVKLRNVRYYNNWNIGWTFLSYKFAYVLVYLYYRLLKKEQILL